MIYNIQKRNGKETSYFINLINCLRKYFSRLKKKKKKKIGNSIIVITTVVRTAAKLQCTAPIINAQLDSPSCIVGRFSLLQD